MYCDCLRRAAKSPYRNTDMHNCDFAIYRDTGIPGYRDTGIQEYRDTGIQEYRDTVIQGYRDT